MRIVYLHQYFNTQSGSTRSYETAKRLVAMGHDVHMITSDRREEAAGRRWRVEDVDGITVHWFPQPYSNRMSYGKRLRAFFSFALAAAVRSHACRGDLVFATSTPLTIALPGIYAARRGRVPMLLEVRDLWPDVPVALGVLRNRLTIAAARWLEWLAYRESSHVVALSPAMRDRVIERGVPAARVEVIPNACDFEVFDIGLEPGQVIRSRHSWLGKRPLVLYTGTLGTVNGVSYLAYVAAKTADIDPEMRFVVLGDGKEYEQVRSLASELGVLERNLFLLGRVEKMEVASWLSAADIALSLVIDCPALWANSANKVFDSLASGTPIGINHEGWQADMLRETGSGLVLPATDHTDAARRLASAVRDSTWCGEAAAAARSVARARFDRGKLVARLESLMRETLVQADRRRGR